MNKAEIALGNFAVAESSRGIRLPRLFQFWCGNHATDKRCRSTVGVPKCHRHHNRIEWITAEFLNGERGEFLDPVAGSIHSGASFLHGEDAGFDSGGLDGYLKRLEEIADKDRNHARISSEESAIISEYPLRRYCVRLSRL